MSRAIVTPELADTIRSLRIQNKIQAKSLAEHLNKSSAYISKLENGQIQTVDYDELQRILQFISGGDGNINELVEQIYATLKIRYSKKEIREQLWLMNFDTVSRRVPIPDSLVDELNGMIDNIGITRSQLLNRINANEALTATEKENDNIVFNQWYCRDTVGGPKYIMIRLSESQLDSILDKEIDVTSYIFVLAITFYLLKIKKFADKISISDEDTKELMDCATDLLNRHKFYSIAEKDALMTKSESSETVADLLSVFDRENAETLNEIIVGFQFASDYDIKQTNAQIKKFAENMQWDLGFMLRLISMNFASLKKTSFSNKKKLLDEINQLISNYSEIPDDMNKIETY